MGYNIEMKKNLIIIIITIILTLLVQFILIQLLRSPMVMSLRANGAPGLASAPIGMTRSVTRPTPMQTNEMAKSVASPSTMMDVAGSGLEYIRQFSINLTSDNTRETFTQIRDITAKYNGLVTNSNISSYDDNPYSGNLDLSVPEDKANDVLQAIHQLNAKITYETATIEEVSAEHKDIQARIDANKAIQEQYNIILKKSKSIKDILAVTERISQYQSIIQALTASNTELTNQVRYVTIHVNITPTPVAIEEPKWSPYRILVDALTTLVSTLQWLMSASIWLVIYFCPLLIIITLLSVLAFKICKRFITDPIRALRALLAGDRQ